MASLTYIEGWPDQGRGPVRVELHLQVVEGRIECVGLLIGLLEKHPRAEDEDFYLPVMSEAHILKAEVLRKLHLPDLIERAVALNEDWLTKATETDPSDWFEGYEHVHEWAAEVLPAMKQRSKPVGRKGHPPEHWVSVASIYREAHSQHKPPTRAVAIKFGVSKSTAAKYVAKARSLGLLPPTTRGKPSI